MGLTLRVSTLMASNTHSISTPATHLADQTPFIFLAEDDLDDQELLIDALNRESDAVTIRTAMNGRKAVTFLEELPDGGLPHLIVLDFNLPELNGGEILQRLARHDRFRAIPKVVWSTSNSLLYRQLSLDLGARAYFVKPVDATGIVRIAREMLSLCNAGRN
jgi:CheY-like chemotaxis protein